MEALALAILKTVATTLVKYYMTSLLGGGNALVYSEAELGYKIPKWYMNPGEATEVIYSYGTSVQGNEFESLEDAKQRALEQMVNHIRLANQKIVTEKIHFDKDNVKQKRLLDLFLRGEGLEDFVRMNAKVDKQQLAKVPKPKDEMRAFVRLAMPFNDYLKHQEQSLGELKHKLMQQKSEDIMAEVDAEVQALEQSRGPDTAAPPQKPEALAPQSAPETPKSSTTPASSADAAFHELEKSTQK